MASGDGQESRIRRSKYADIPLPPQSAAPAAHGARYGQGADLVRHQVRGPVPWSASDAVPRGENAESVSPRQGAGAACASPEPDATMPDADPAIAVEEGSPRSTSPAGSGRQGNRNGAGRQAPKGRGSGRRGRNRYDRRLSPLRPFAVAAVAIVLSVALIGVIDAAANWGKIYPGVKIGNVDVSGMNALEAQAAVQAEYAGRINGAQVRIYADQETLEKARSGQKIEDPDSSEYISVEEAARNRKVWNANASILQARLATEELVDEALAVGREDGGVLGRMAAQTFGYAIDPRVDMSDAAIENLAGAIDRAIGTPREDYGISIEEGVATVTEGHDGDEVDRSWLRSEIESQMLADYSDHSMAAWTQYAPVRIDEAAAQEVAEQVNAAIDCGATFAFNGTFWNATTAELGDLIQTRLDDSDGGWRLVPYYEESSAKNAILTHLQSNFSDQDISVEFVKSGDSIMVKTNAAGTMPEVGEAVKRLEERTLGEEPKDTPMIEVDGTQIPAAMSIQAAMDYGIITTVSEYETEYTGGATARNTNIHLAADLLNDSIVKANGGEWSFNGTAGECNAEKGFQNAGAISGGETVDEIGGGICQVATTVFNAVFVAGYPVDQRRNHSLYIASYPAGRDAAISWPDLDLVWHNDTPNDILLQTSWDDTTVTVSLLGVDPGYRVSSHTGEFQKGAEHSTRTVADPSLPDGATEVRQTGQDGSSIEVTRTVKDMGGQILRQDEFVSVYDAKDEIIATGAAAGAGL